MHVDVRNRHPRLRGPVAAARVLVSAILERVPHYRPAGGELSLAFVTDREIAQLHATFLNDPSPTDVITFHGDPDFDFAGEIVVSVDHARDQAAARGLPFANELTLYLIHGWLHLCGLDDRTPEQRTTMRAAEQEVLSLLPDLPIRFLLKD